HAGAFRPDDVLLLETLAAQLAPAVENAQLFRDLGASYDHTLDALAAALDARDKETEGHSRRVVAFTLALARRMNLPEEELATIQRGAILHDIGKIGVPDAILLKPGPLTDEERAIMRNHPEWGRRILSGIPFLAGAAEIVRAHQERWDGAGYPQGRKGEAIPLGARIFAVADTFDAITSDRPYRAGRSYAVARAEIEAGRGTQFDPRFVDAFRQIPEDEWSRLRAEAISTPIAAGPLPLWAEPPAASPELEELHRLIADRLTGAHNRSYLEGFVARELQRSARYGHGISLVLLDVDDFKAYNEAHGPAAGDEALRRLVRQLRRNVRSADVIARYAEDEFAVVLPETDAEGARLAGEKFRIAIESHAFPHGGLTVSLGVANCAIAGGMSTDVLIAMADQALADAKRRGRNGVSVWGPEMAELPKPTEGAVPAAVE
ncbi:MAG: diguanylate cyclase, partial [Chloroflexi bacterium]|nr:diguanylate cyclase [Chloroflexota bacterium]